jgi:isoleucyl-tRNA synthetase
VSDRIVLDVVCFDDADAQALGLATGAEIASETLATTFAIHSSATFDLLPTMSGQLASEWLGNVTSAAVEHFARFDAGAFANAGDFVVAVSRTEQIQSV